MKNHSLGTARFKASVLALAALAFTACNPIENGQQSNSLLLVETVTGLDMTGNEGNLCQSDVQFINSETGLSIVTADLAKAILSAQTLDPNPILGTSQYADIQLLKYAVTYVRADGKSTPGVDVPYSFEAGLSGIIRIGQTTTVSFVVVREAAKQEPPLLNLRATTTRGETLEVTARIDFYGKDLSGRAVKATGYLLITFADFANS